MTFKPKVWFPIATVLSVLNVGAVWFAAVPAQPMHATVHAALAVGFALWAARLRQRLGAGMAATGSLQDQVEIQAAALQEAESSLASQASQLAELQDRVDFAERLLIQARDRSVRERPDGS
ncbi:MAG TPA: hypothetical protein VJU15_11410 [Gemmatimonadales bacterium]|nr:hypothetical protein [Gemmatimonadales bacterium]